MLPSSKKYLIKGGFTPSVAAWILLGCFMSGFVGIQIVSRFLHHHIPSRVVGCDHIHAETPHTHDHSAAHSHTSHNRSRRHSHTPNLQGVTNGKSTESTPLLPSESCDSSAKLSQKCVPSAGADDELLRPHGLTESRDRRPSMIEVQKRVMSFVKDIKSNCDSSGPCYGYSDPCGQECFKHLGSKTPNNSRHATFLRTATGNLFNRPLEEERSDVTNGSVTGLVSPRVMRAHSREPMDEACESDEEGLEAQHHHHVPENAFMSIGLQTSIAIALHKLPEGFITYATNHANPHLGFSVFMALFVHNITEGFAMALPLYLALGSRVRAMFWASLLGGVSQPLGAGIAAAWFKIAGHYQEKPGSALYGCMFAVTAGIMASVALQLFVESLSLNHNRNLCIAFAFIGMAIMGVSNALTSE
jgi:ZIP family zinc transporter